MKEITEQEAYLRLTALCAQAEHCQHEMLEKMKKWELADEAQARVMERLIKEPAPSSWTRFATTSGDGARWSRRYG